MTRRVAVVALALTGVAIVVCGCGGSKSTTSANAGGRTPAKFRHPIELALEYSGCMRTHGVPGFADPKISVSATRLDMQNPQMTPTEVASPAYRYASAACAKYLPQQAQAAVAGGGSSETQALRFADCMRMHGVPGFPDPGSTGPFKLGPGLDLQAPAFAVALADCRKSRPSQLELSS
jgi:hypothetical protein